MNRKRSLAVMAVMVAALCAACSSPPKERFYTLAPAPGAMPPATASAQPRTSVAIGPVRLPDAVDRPQLVVREGPNRVEILEQQRWAGSLRGEIARALVAGVGERLPEAQVSVGDSQAGRSAVYRVAIDVERFDAALNDSVSIQALWTVRQDSGAQVASGRYSASEPAGGGGYDAIAAAYSRTLAGMSGVIADAVRGGPVGVPARR
ncbi:MAG: rane integrity-associated transporter subunit PqiC [Burkholderia sp.]|nr:rane integrity-associated transporter subunit PqiC [Burkholderia sp.]